MGSEENSIEFLRNNNPAIILENRGLCNTVQSNFESSIMPDTIIYPEKNTVRRKT